MIDPLLGAGIVGAGAEGIRRLFAGWKQNQHAAQRRSQGAENERRRGCYAVLREFLRRQGYLAQTVARRGELRDLIDNGIQPEKLRALLVERALKVKGVLLGYQRSRGPETAVRLPLSLRLRHVLVPGRTGTGKSTLLHNMVIDDAESGAGLAVIAPEAEMISEGILPHLPPSRWDDVVVIDPGDLGRPVSINPLHLDQGEDPDLKAAELLAILRRISGDETGSAAPRLEMLLGEAIPPLIRLPDTTLLDIERLLDRQDDSFRRWVIEHTEDERTRRFWRETYSTYPKDAHLSLLHRLGRFLRPRVVRNLLCQPGPSFNMRRAMDEGKIILVSLSDGLLGEQNADILGQLLVAKIQLAAMSRADIPPEERRPFFLYLDEFQRTANIATTSYAQLLSRSRKYSIGLILAQQHLAQIPDSLLRDVLGNVHTIICFQVGASDARRLSREFVGQVRGELRTIDPALLVNLSVGQAVCRIGRSLVRLRTLPPRSGGNPRVRGEILRRSRERYGLRAVKSEPCGHVDSTVTLPDPKDVL